MMDFLILGYPRSATTWLANLFTTDRTICLHDPIFDKTLEELDDYHVPGRIVGASCTGLWLYPDWIVRQDCPKLVVVRDKAECDASLAEIHLPVPPPEEYRKLFAIDALRLPFADLWKEHTMRMAWKHLLPGVRFDAERYHLLRTFSIQPQFQETPVKAEVMQDFLRRAMGG